MVFTGDLVGHIRLVELSDMEGCVRYSFMDPGLSTIVEVHF